MHAYCSISQDIESEENSKVSKYSRIPTVCKVATNN